MRPSRLLRRSRLACFLLAGLASAQQFPFQLNLSQDDSIFAVPNGAALTFSSPVGQPKTARITAIYRGRGQTTITQGPDVFGSAAFTAVFPSSLPLTLNPGESFAVDIQFRPISTAVTTAQFSLGFTDTVPGTGTNAPPTVSIGTINLTLQGTAPSFVLSYILQADLNVIPLQSGGSIVFPATQLNATSQATLNISNRGSGSGQITDVVLTGSPAFRLIGLPLFPVTVSAAESLQLAIRYQPTQVASDSAQIQVTFDSGARFTILLQGSGVSTLFVYELLQPDATVPVQPGETISLPGTNLGETSSLAIRVRSTAAVATQVNSLSVIGAGFQIIDGPLLPQILAPNSSFTFTVVFTPTQPGPVNARLIVGPDIFNLAGQGLGPRLVFSYNSGSSIITVPTGATPGSIVFSPVTITRSSQLDLTVRNTGTLAATVSNIGIGEPRSPFSLSGLPPLPVVIAPNTELRFPITFTPAATGFASGTLRFDSLVIGLTGSGTAPPPLPSYTIQGPGGQIEPLSQPGVSLKLSSPYPGALAGVLTMSFSGDLLVDPAVQFATGGRTVPFVIPANSTDAVFAGQGTQIRLQTGTVANTVILTPSFATQAGGVDLTPDPPVSQQFVVAASAPTLLAVQATTRTTNGFTLVVQGFSTTRSITNLSVQFTPSAGFNVPTTQFTIDLRQDSRVWFQSGSSQPFGGQFVVAVPFNFQGTVPTGQSAVDSIASVSVTVSNERGSSQSLQTALR